MGLGAVAAATIGSAAIGAGASMMASNKAASSADKASALDAQRYAQIRSDLAPYNVAGQGVLGPLNALAMSGPTGGGPDYVDLAYKNYLPGTMTQAQLEQTPGYQFTLGQGLKAVQSARAAKGLGVSGAALKGAAQFATGLADQTYKDQFNIQQQRFADVTSLSPLQQNQINNQYSRLSGIATLGENAAAQTGTQGTQLAQLQGNALQQAGLAQSAGITGVSSAVNQGAQNYLGYTQMQDLINRRYPVAGTGGTSSYTPTTTTSDTLPFSSPYA
jgi:hypothetical protein